MSAAARSSKILTPTGQGGSESSAGLSPTRVSLSELIQLRPTGEMIKLSAPRIRAFTAGGHLSPFKGRGVEYDESRPYQEGDDLRTIDWRVTARTGKPHTKVFREERNRPVIVWLDLGESMMFATQGAYKSVVAARAAAIVTWSAVANGDQLGGLVFDPSDHAELRPRLGRRAALRLLQLIAAHEGWRDGRRDNGGTGDAAAFEHALGRLLRVARPGSLVWLCSDFVGQGPDFARQITQLASHGDVNLLHVYDPIEAELPPPGRYRINMGKKTLTIDTSDTELRRRFQADFAARCEQLAGLGRLPGVKLVSCASNEDPAAVLRRHFARR
ncbi:MAG: DUF58 domain-containing protein [Gammaproteobacteria bacterium]|nr:DUF58 domain-containing protein [Gammaproteobacteria bacterium]